MRPALAHHQPGPGLVRHEARHATRLAPLDPHLVPDDLDPLEVRIMQPHDVERERHERDLGAWASEAYRVPAVPGEDDVPEGPEEAEG